MHGDVGGQSDSKKPGVPGLKIVSLYVCDVWMPSWIVVCEALESVNNAWLKT